MELLLSLRLSAKSLSLSVTDTAPAEHSQIYHEGWGLGLWEPLVGAVMSPSVEILASFMFDGAALGFLLPSLFARLRA